MKKRYGLIIERNRAFIMENNIKEKLIACKALAFVNGEWHILSHCGYITETDELEGQVSKGIVEDVQKIVVTVNCKKMKASIEFDNSDTRFQIKKMILVWRIVDEEIINGLILKQKRNSEDYDIARWDSTWSGDTDNEFILPILEAFCHCIADKEITDQYKRRLSIEMEQE